MRRPNPPALAASMQEAASVCGALRRILGHPARVTVLEMLAPRAYPILLAVICGCTTHLPADPEAPSQPPPPPPPAPVETQPAVTADPPAAAPSAETPPAGSEGGGRVAFVQCDPEKRPQMCTKEYRPVCGEVDTGVRCVTTPCPSTEKKAFATGCTACADAKVTGYWPRACEDLGNDAK